MTVEAHCNLTATLYRQTVNKGRSGGQNASTYTADPNVVDVPVSVQPSRASMQIMFAQRRMPVDCELYFSENYNVYVGNRWQLSNGRIFNALGWFESLEINDNWTCPCQEIREPPFGGPET